MAWTSALRSSPAGWPARWGARGARRILASGRRLQPAARRRRGVPHRKRRARDPRQPRAHGVRSRATPGLCLRSLPRGHWGDACRFPPAWRGAALRLGATFTPTMGGSDRPWHVGVLWDRDEASARYLISGLRARRDSSSATTSPTAASIRPTSRCISTPSRPGCRTSVSRSARTSSSRPRGRSAGCDAWQS